MLAWEEAAQHYRAALRARELAGAIDDHVRAELLLALGASEDRAGLEEEARETFRVAIRTARQLGDAVLITRAALGVAGPWSALSRSDPDRVGLLDEALEVLPEEDSPLRARLLARMSLELYYAGEPELRLSLSDEAVAIARRTGDLRTLATCLDARHYALWLPENVEERLEVAAELRRVAEETGDPELELQGAGWTIIDLMELGDIDGVDIQIAAASKLAEALHRPVWLWWTSLFRGARALLAGHLDEAERLAQETLAIGQRGQAENALHYYAQTMFNIRREQGRLAEVEGAVRGFIELYPAIPAWRGALALLLVELGRPDEARAEFEQAAEGGFAAFPRDANWLIAITLMAEVCGALGDAARAEELYRLLEPYAGNNVVVGRNATNYGSASRLLGLLAATRGENELAERHYDRAQEMHAKMGARPMQARTQVSYAELLLNRRAPGDVERAREMLADAVSVADALGMVVLAERARRLVPLPAGA
jgi:tetratricopeptide (TPR) repeat protein